MCCKVVGLQLSKCFIPTFTLENEKKNLCSVLCNFLYSGGLFLVRNVGWICVSNWCQFISVGLLLRFVATLQDWLVFLI